MIANWKVMAAVIAASAFANMAAAEPVGSKIEPLSFKACGEKYREAKAQDLLSGRNWFAFRREVCGIRGSAAQPILARSEATSSEALRRVAFPVGLAEEFRDRTPAQQRMRTCLKAYHENKQAGTLAGLRWVQRGGGYYSLCTARLKAEAA